MVVVAGYRRPSAHAGFIATHLYDAGQIRMIGDLPVEAVAAEIHQTAPAALVGSHTAPHPGRPIFRMGSRQHHAVRREQRQAATIQLLVRDHVVLDAVCLQPVDDMGVRIELVDLGSAHIRFVFRPHVQDRTQAGGIGDAAAVAMGVVEGRAVFAVLVQKQILLVQDR